MAPAAFVNGRARRVENRAVMRPERSPALDRELGQESAPVEQRERRAGQECRPQAQEQHHEQRGASRERGAGAELAHNGRHRGQRHQRGVVFR